MNFYEPLCVKFGNNEHTSAIFPNSPICSAYKVLMNTTKKTVHTQHSFKDLVALTLIRARGLLLLSIQALNFVLSAP